MDNKRFPKTASDSNQNHQRLKRGWQNIDDIKTIVQAKFKENLWCIKN
jgi:hypothetical protein